jgi:hypothetical protein
MRDSLLRSPTPPPSETPAGFYTFAQLAERWKCSESHVRRMVELHKIKVVDFAQSDRKGKKLVPAASVQKLEKILTRQASK